MFISESVKGIFQENGWYEGRQVDINPYLEWFKENNISSNEFVNKILKEFGGININAPFKNVKGGYISKLEFDPRRCIFDEEELPEFEEMVNEKLTPIAFSHGQVLDIFVSQSGKIYFAGNYEFMLIKYISSDFYEMLEIYNNKEFLDKRKFPNLFDLEK